MRRVHHRDKAGPYSVSVLAFRTACDRKALGLRTTRKWTDVTCKNCLRARKAGL